MSDQDDIRATTARAIAQACVVTALVRTHPDQQILRDVVEQFVEATRANLLASNWTDEQVHAFDNSIGQLLNTLPPPSSK